MLTVVIGVQWCGEKWYGGEWYGVCGTTASVVSSVLCFVVSGRLW